MSIIPKASSKIVTKVMRANSGADTKPELILRSHIHRKGLRYSINTKPEKDLNRRADVVFRGVKVAVFVHGCFWHGCKAHFKLPKTNKSFWSKKIQRNRIRDRETTSFLRHRGWKVMVAWEHQDLEKFSEKVKITVLSRRARDSTPTKVLT